MKFTKNQFIWLAVLFFSCFLIYTYWETVVSICNTIFVASQPFLVGAGIAFVVNILMSFYEKWLVKLVPFAFTHNQTPHFFAFSLCDHWFSLYLGSLYRSSRFD